MRWQRSYVLVIVLIMWVMVGAGSKVSAKAKIIVVKIILENPLNWP